jgi:hypothetical protein
MMMTIYEYVCTDICGFGEFACFEEFKKILSNSRFLLFFLSPFLLLVVNGQQFFAIIFESINQK